MRRIELNRRDFNRLTVAAFGGVVAGTVAGCGDDDDVGTDDSGDGSADGGDSGDDSTETDGSPGNGEKEPVGGELPEHNACLGLNQCKEYGKNPGEHDCRGRGDCATVASDGPGKNECKFLGGCNPPGANDCKGKGGCQVPLAPFGDEVWQQARTVFEKRMKAKGVTVGKAPLPES